MKFIFSNSYVIELLCFIFINSKEIFGKTDSIIKRETIARNIKTKNNLNYIQKQNTNSTMVINATKHRAKRNTTAKFGEKIIKTYYSNG